PRPDASAERDRERARRKNRSHSSAMARIFTRTKAASTPAGAAAVGGFISTGRLRACLIRSDRVFRSATVQDARSRDEGLAALFRGASDAVDWAVPPEKTSGGTY
ncbi:MAG: hypothetical protein JXA30_11400, partial [Deltaproteobacteria bacterium]|nr:hypothetical protein [Deltaproteobacteria bacterium]